MKKLLAILFVLLSVAMFSCAKDEVVEPDDTNHNYLNHDPFDCNLNTEITEDYQHFYFSISRLSEKSFIDKVVVVEPDGKSTTYNKNGMIVEDFHQGGAVFYVDKNANYSFYVDGKYSVTVYGRFFIDEKPFTCTKYYENERDIMFGSVYIPHEGSCWEYYTWEKDTPLTVEFGVQAGDHAFNISYVKITKIKGSVETTVIEETNLNVADYTKQYTIVPTETGDETWRTYVTNTNGTSWTFDFLLIVN